MKYGTLFKKRINIDRLLKQGCLIVLSLCLIGGTVLLMMGEIWFSLEIFALTIPALIWLLRYSPSA